MSTYDIDSTACLYLMWRHKPKYFDPPTIKVNTSLPTGRTYTPKEYHDFMESAQHENEITMP